MDEWQSICRIHVSPNSQQAARGLSAKGVPCVIINLQWPPPVPPGMKQSSWKDMKQMNPETNF